jgi:hypothetical protein
MIPFDNTQFRWFFGAVEDREDPKQLGRVRVRAYHYYSEDQNEVPKDLLPWALVLSTPTSAGIKEVGRSPTGLMVGSLVFGFFLDGEDCQMPVILGSIAGIPNDNEDEHEVAQLARGINNVVKALYGPEPDSPYNAEYPYNKVFTTERGHVVEFDDTPDNERIHVMHTSGTYIEVDNEGTRVDKIVGDRYTIVMGKDTVRVRGNVRIVVEGDADITVKKTADVKVNDNASVYVSGDTKVVGLGEVNVTATDNINISTTQSLNLNSGGNMTIQSQGSMTLRGLQIHLNPPG